jgi:hypothetical protein
VRGLLQALAVGVLADGDEELAGEAFDLVDVDGQWSS